MKLFIKKIVRFRPDNILLSILLLAFLLRLIGLDQSLWLDEGAQVMQSSKPFMEVWKLHADFQPPLFYYLVRIWMYGGTKVWYLRLISVFSGVGVVWVGYLIGKLLESKNKFKQILSHRSSKNVAYWIAFLLAINPYLIYYSQELRMYSWSALLVSLLFYVLLKKKWSWYALLLLLNLYNLYIAFFLIPVLGWYVWSSERKHFYKWINSTALALLGFVFWLPVMLSQLQKGFALPMIWPEWKLLSSPGFVKSLPLTFAKFMWGHIDFDNNLLWGGMVLFAGLIACPLLYIAWVNRNRYINLLFYWFLGPLILAWVVSIWIPLNGPWRLLMCLPALSILLGYGIIFVKNRFMKTVLASGLVLVSLGGLFLYYFNLNFQREDWSSAVGWVEKKVELSYEKSSPSIVTFAYPHVFSVYQWYASDMGNAYAVLGDYVIQNKDRQRLVSVLKDKSTVYHFDYLSDLSDPNRQILKWLEELGFKQKKIYNYRGVGLIYEYVKKVKS